MTKYILVFAEMRYLVVTDEDPCFYIVFVIMCCRFLARYPEYPGLFDATEICLDEVAKDLSETFL